MKTVTITTYLFRKEVAKENDLHILRFRVFLTIWQLVKLWSEIIFVKIYRNFVQIFGSLQNDDSLKFRETPKAYSIWSRIETEIALEENLRSRNFLNSSISLHQIDHCTWNIVRWVSYRPEYRNLMSIKINAK